MRKRYDFSKMKGRKNPYVKYLKQPVTRDCAMHRRKLHMKWES